MNIIPLPNDYIKQSFQIKFSNYEIIIPKKIEKAAAMLNQELQIKLTIDETKKPYTFEFELNNDFQEEEYKITMEKDITLIEGKNEKSLFYATRSLSQLLKLNQAPFSIKKLECDAYTIKDKPRFAMRSFMIDECRHFFGKEEIYKFIHLLSNLKFNYFHWHLSDDQGFRINFETFPNLKDIASKRKRTRILNEETGPFDETPYEHCYSYLDIKDVIHYAKQHYIEIIPEIDVPGHTSAIVAAYPELHCFGKQQDVPGNFGVFKEIMCPGKEKTYTFTKKLFDELCLLFKDSTFIHIGGDEVNHENWENCEDCKRKMQENHLESTEALQAYFSNSIAQHLIEKGKKVIMWNDGIQDNTNPNIIMQYWDWKMDERRIQYINEGRKSIYSPCSQVYFNDPYAELPLIRTYNRGIHLDKLTYVGRSNILAMEGCIWSEWIPNGKMLEFLTNPRLEALSEAAWSKSSKHNYTDFLHRMKEFYHVLDTFNFEYASLHLARAKGSKYREKTSKLFRQDQKFIEYELDKKSKLHG